MRLKLRSKISSVLVGLGILTISGGIIFGLGSSNPLRLGYHIFIVIIGLSILLLSIIINRDEETFASKYDMTHILDLESKEERYNAYLSHLSSWVASDMENVNPKMRRGEDPSGPDWGKTDFKLGQKPKRRDAIVEGQKYTGMEGDLTIGEKMIEDANNRYAKIAQSRWEKSEANDQDLIEYGVERLGDLVKTDYFVKNAEEGAFSKIAKGEDVTRDSINKLE